MSEGIKIAENQKLNLNEFYGLAMGPSRNLMVYIGDYDKAQAEGFAHRFVGPGIHGPVIFGLKRGEYTLLENQDTFASEEEEFRARIVLGGILEGKTREFMVDDYNPLSEPLPSEITTDQVNESIKKIQGAKQKWQKK